MLSKYKIILLINNSDNLFFNKKMESLLKHKQYCTKNRINYSIIDCIDVKFII